MKNNTNFNNEFPNFDQFISSFKNSTNPASSSDSSNDTDNIFNNIDLNTLLKIKKIVGKVQDSKNNPRSNLLLSLKPYLSNSKREKLDKYINILNMSSIIEDLNPMGGEKTK